MLPIKSFLIVLAALVFVLFAIGIIKYEKRGYGCYPESSDMYEWKDKVEVLNVGALHFYVQPLIKDCPEDYRYDPSRAIDCGAYCTQEQLNGG